MEMKFYKDNDAAIAPEYGTAESSCFDLRACLAGVSRVKVWSGGQVSDREVIRNSVIIYGGERMIIPTGLIFDIPVGYEIKAYARSGLSIKNGIGLANMVGVIDADYTDPTGILLWNTNNVKEYTSFEVKHGDRLIQAQLQLKAPQVTFTETLDRIPDRGDRIGGMGSTGVK